MHISFLKIHVVFSFCIWFGKLFTPTAKHLFWGVTSKESGALCTSQYHCEVQLRTETLKFSA